MPRKNRDDDDDTVSSAAAEIEAELAQAKSKKTQESTAPDEVEIDLDEEDDDEEDAPPARTSEEQRSRNERRRDRYRANKEAAEAAERRAQEAEERAREATLRADALALSFRQQTQQQSPAKDPLDAELEAAETERQRLWDDVSNTPQAAMTPERLDWINKRTREIDRNIFSIIARKEARGVIPPPQNQPSLGRMIATTQYPDVAAHPEGFKRIDALLQYKFALGEPQNEMTFHAVAKQVRAELGTQRQSRDVQSLKGKLGHSSASRGSGAGAPERRVVKLDANHRKLAKAAYKGMGLTDQQMFARFAKEHMSEDS